MGGTLPTLSREEVKTYIESHSGKAGDSISKKTSYLVLGKAPGSNLDMAHALGVPILDEAYLRRLAGENLCHPLLDLGVDRLPECWALPISIPIDKRSRWRQ